MILPIATVTVAWSVRLSVTLMHPAEDTGWNEMPFGRTHMGSQITLYQTGALVLHVKGRFGGP